MAADDKKPEAPVLTEIAVATGVDYTGWVEEILRPGDEILDSLGGDLKQYERLMRDHQVRSTFQQRRDAVIACEWDVDPGGEAPIDQQAADFLRDQLANIRWDEKTRKMLAGVFYGYAVGECMWGYDGGRIVLTDILVRKPRRFRWDKDGRLRLMRVAHVPEIMPDRKFWTFSAGGDDDEDPYGRGLAHWLYWPVFFKRNGAKFWALFLEKFAGPTGKATYPRNASKEEIEKALQAALSLATDSAVAVPEGFEVALVEAMRSASGDYLAFAQYWDNAVSKIILSQTGTTDAGPYVGTANAHGDVRDAVVKSDADLVCESFNDGPARWLTEWNFPGAAVPKVWRRTEPPEDLAQAAERDTKIHSMGFEPSEEYIQTTYGDGWTKKQAAPPPVQPGRQPPLTRLLPGQVDPSFAEAMAAQVEALDAATRGVEDAAAPAMDAIIERIRAEIEAAGDLPDLAARLLSTFPEIDSNGLARALETGLVAAQLIGAAEVPAEER